MKTLFALLILILFLTPAPSFAGSEQEAIEKVGEAFFNGTDAGKNIKENAEFIIYSHITDEQRKFATRTWMMMEVAIHGKINYKIEF